MRSIMWRSPDREFTIFLYTKGGFAAFRAYDRVFHRTKSIFAGYFKRREATLSQVVDLISIDAEEIGNYAQLNERQTAWVMAGRGEDLGYAYEESLLRAKCPTNIELRPSPC